MRKRAALLLQDAARITGAVAVVPSPSGAAIPEAPTVPEQIAAARAEILGTDTPEAEGLPTDIGGLRTLIRTMLGQQAMPTGTMWPMSNNRSAKRLDTVEPQVAQALVQVATLADVVKDGLEDIGTKFDLLNSQRQLDLSALLVERTRNDLQDAKDELQDAAILQLQAQDKLTIALDTLQSAQLEQNRLDILALAARQTATEKKQAADELDIAALKASDANQNAQLTAQASGIEADRLLALAAQATADQAKADAKGAKDLAQTAKSAADQAETDAQLAKSAAATAQAAANTAQAGVTAANIRIDGVVTNVAAAQASATAAQAAAANAQAAVTALGDKGRVLLNVATPASAGLLGIGGTMSVPLSWAKAFPGTNYGGSFMRTSGGSAAMGVSLTNKTTTSCTLVLTLTGTVSLAVPAGTGDVVLTYSS